LFNNSFDGYQVQAGRVPGNLRVPSGTDTADEHIRDVISAMTNHARGVFEGNTRTLRILLILTRLISLKKCCQGSTVQGVAARSVKIVSCEIQGAHDTVQEEKVSSDNG
jgi:hypothetical protein